ncbi:MAG: L-cysteate sulfo-lyase [Phycisphaerae bacterium]|nr:L-cysteate sulfo-lyase [Phycisphaerae bacterium]
MDAGAKLDALPRLRLCQLPTPIQRMTRLEKTLGLADGPHLWIKRDDLTGLAFGGNKGRKLEFSLAEAREQQADVVMTRGGVQSNHCRQTAVAAAALGMEPHLFLSGPQPAAMTGNLLPSQLVGARFHFNTTGDDMVAFADQLKAQGRRPYVIPTGASNPTGAMGYVNAAREIVAQQRELGVAFDWIVCATGSCGTQAGLLVGARLFSLSAAVMGVAVSPPRDIASRREDVASLAARTADRLGLPAPVDSDNVLFEGGYAGEGYAIPTAAGTQAIELLARTEGVFLDPCYTAKAFSGLLDQLGKGRFDHGDQVLFLHTGGNVALFA